MFIDFLKFAWVTVYNLLSTEFHFESWDISLLDIMFFIVLFNVLTLFIGRGGSDD